MNLHFKKFSVIINIKTKIYVDNKVADSKYIWLSAPNGTGKTSVLNCIYGLQSFKGSIIIDGKEINNCSRSNLRNEFSYFRQKPVLIPKATIGDNIKLLNIDECVFKKYLSRFYFKSKLNKKIIELSGGERQVVGLCIALSKNSNYLLLDEPTNNLSSENVNNLIQVLESEKRDVIYTSHSELELNYLKIDITGWRAENE